MGGYQRASITIPMSQALVDQLMNGPTGYRAHYAASVEDGEKFNRALVEAIAPLVIETEGLYAGFFSRAFCNASLMGRFTKVWFPKHLTDPSAQVELLQLEAAITHPAWVAHWHSLPRPHKGLLAPMPEPPAILLNGTFVDAVGD